MNSIASVPDPARSLVRQAGAAFAAGQHGEALRLYETALRFDARNERALFGAASCHHALGDLPRAAALFGSLAKAHPEKAMYHYNQGYSLLQDAQYDAAAKILRKCCERIQDPHVKANLAIALESTSNRDLASARRLLEEAAASLMNDASVQSNLAYLQLLMGDYAAGWRQHERRAILQRVIASTPVPLWQGESLAGKTLLLWCEQGLGDSLQFVRYLPLVARRAVADGGSVAFQPPPSLYRLFATSFLALAPAVTILSPDEPVTQFDVHCSLMSLPERMHTTVDTVPAEIPYLHAEPLAVAQWQERLSTANGMKVGLVWGGDSGKGHDPIFQRADRRRSTSLEQFALLFDIPGITYFSLQKGEPANQARSMSGRSNFIDYTDELLDFADTAALTANLDLVITVDTSVCHLAGGLGCEVWLLNRWDACWRWLLGRDDSPWYPTLTQYRQTIHGDWSDVVSRIARDLRLRVDANTRT